MSLHENFNIGKTLGKGKISPKLTSGKILALSNVLHVLEMHRNLISHFLLNKAGMKLMFGSNKLNLTRGGDFIG